MKIKKHLVVFLFLALFTHLTYAQSLLALDMRNAVQLPKNFRTTSDPVPNHDLNLKGLHELHAAASGQFSKLGLQQALQHFPNKHILILDLRQESHGFLNGNAISWYAKQNAENVGLQPDQIEETQSNLLDQLNEQISVETANIVKTDLQGKVNKISVTEFSVHQIASEAQVVDALHLPYQRLYVTDHRAPTDEQVDRFIQIVKQLAPDEWIYMHCRGGSGRSTTFMMMYDMMRNAKTVSFEDIFARQAALGEDLEKLTTPKDFKYAYQKQRLAFLQAFYQYARDNKDGFTTLWSQTR